MTTTLLLKLALRALNEIPNRMNIAGLPEAEGNFAERFSSYELATEIERHFKDSAGFTVILQYPSDPFQTYSGFSREQTWEAAVADVARQMRSDNPGSIDHGDEVNIVDVLEGENPSAPGCDLNATVLFRKSGPVVIDHSEMAREVEYFHALWMATDSAQTEGLDFTSALKRAASANGISDGVQMEAFLAWARGEWPCEDTGPSGA